MINFLPFNKYKPALEGKYLCIADNTFHLQYYDYNEEEKKFYIGVNDQRVYLRVVAWSFDDLEEEINA